MDHLPRKKKVMFTQQTNFSMELKETHDSTIQESQVKEREEESPDNQFSLIHLAVKNHLSKKANSQ